MCVRVCVWNACIEQAGSWTRNRLHVSLVAGDDDQVGIRLHPTQMIGLVLFEGMSIGRWLRFIGSLIGWEVISVIGCGWLIGW